MAEAIAAEWDAQDEMINPQTMPVTRTANAAIDKVAPQHAEVADMLAAYGDSDLLCYRADTPAGTGRAADRRLGSDAGLGAERAGRPAGAADRRHACAAGPRGAGRALRHAYMRRRPLNWPPFTILVSLTGSLDSGLCCDA